MFTATQRAVLRQPLTRSRVYEHRGNSYLATWDVRAHLTRIFGFGNWDFHVVDLTQCDAWATHDDAGKPSRFWAAYRCVGRLTVRDRDGNEVTYEDAAVGEASNQTSVGSAHDLAVKSSVSGALKRCAVNLGTQFGLSLYADTLNDVIVKMVGDDDVLSEHDDLPDVSGEGDDEPIGDYA